MLEGDLRGKPMLGQNIILQRALLESQYTKLNFSYQSVLFSYYFFLFKSVPFGDCVVS